MLHRTRDLLMRQRTSLINAIRYGFRRSRTVIPILKPDSQGFISSGRLDHLLVLFIGQA